MIHTAKGNVGYNRKRNVILVYYDVKMRAMSSLNRPVDKEKQSNERDVVRTHHHHCDKLFIT